MSHSKAKKYSFGQFGATLPSEALLRPYQQCHDLCSEYLYLKGQAILLGESLDAKLARGGGNPAKRAWKQKKIDDYEYLLIEKLIGVYQSIFSLIQGAWEDLRDSFTPMGVEDEINLFYEVLREHFDSKFNNCIRGYKLTCADVHNTAKLFQQKIFPILSDPSKVGEALPKKSDYFWLPLILKQSRDLSQSDIVIKELIQSVDQQVGNFVSWHSAYLTECRHQPDPEKRIYSKKWENQKMYVGCRGGGYKHVLNKTQHSFSETFDRPSSE